MGNTIPIDTLWWGMRIYWIMLLHILGLFLGILAIISGESDDSPGLQGLGLIFLLAVLYSMYKKIKANRNR